MARFVGLRAKNYSSLIDDRSEDKKAKDTKKCVLKKNCSEATQFENKINHLEKNKTDIDSLEEDHKQFIKTIN